MTLAWWLRCMRPEHCHLSSSRRTILSIYHFVRSNEQPNNRPKHTLIKAGSCLQSSLFAYNIYNQCKHAVATAKWRRASEQTSNIWEQAQLTIAPCISALRFSFSCAPTAKLIQSNKYYKRIDNGADGSEEMFVAALVSFSSFFLTFSLPFIRSCPLGSVPCTRRAPHRFAFHRTHVQL